MARSIAVIKQQILDAKNADTSLSGRLTSTSQTATWNLWAFITAVAINLHEQLWDIFKQEIETIASGVTPGTAGWLRNKVFEFQYSASDPQLLQVINFVPRYDAVLTDLRIIARCSVKQQTDRRVLVKVAKADGDDLVPLTTQELNALKSYVDDIKFAGTSVGVISLEADRLQVKATVFYDGQFVESSVKNNVIAAITDYLANLPFDGVFSNTKLVDAIEAVPGVKDIIIYQDVTGQSADIQQVGIKARKEQIPVGSAQVVTRLYEAEAGYIIPEDSVGFTLNDTITMQPA